MAHFRYVDRGVYEVFHNGIIIGRIVRCDHLGRVLYRLECDRSPHPRTFRGRQVAAEALALAYDLAEVECSRIELVIRAWERRPRP